MSPTTIKLSAMTTALYLGTPSVKKAAQDITSLWKDRERSYCEKCGQFVCECPKAIPFNPAFLTSHLTKWQVIHARMSLGIPLQTALTQYNELCRG